jgi:hypothetical protein
MTQNKIYKKTYEYNKPYFYKWRVEHPEKNRELNKNYQRRHVCWKRAQKIFLNILLEE